MLSTLYREHCVIYPFHGISEALAIICSGWCNLLHLLVYFSFKPNMQILKGQVERPVI